MSAREDQLRRMLSELAMRGLHAVRNHRNAIARADLRRECLHVQADLNAEAEALRADALAADDPRPQPPLPDMAPPAAAPAIPATPFEARLPYPKDD